MILITTCCFKSRGKIGSKSTDSTEVEVRKQDQIKISNKFADLEKLYDSEGINRVWENIKENIKLS